MFYKFSIALVALQLCFYASSHGQHPLAVQVPTDWQWEASLQKIPVYLGVDTIDAYPPTTQAPENWWSAFGSKTLDSLMELAFADNIDRQIAQTRIDQAQSRVTIARSFQAPQVFAEPGFTRNEFSGNRPAPFDIVLDQITLNTWSLPLNASYEVDLFGRLKSNVEIAKLELAVSRASKLEIDLIVATGIARHFFSIGQLDTEKAIILNNIRTRLENLEIAQVRYNAGLVSEIDVQRAQTEVASARLQLQTNEMARAEFVLSLAALCGQPANTFSLPETPLRYLPPRIRPSAPESLTSTRPELVTTAYRIDAGAEQIEARKKARLPSLFLNGSIGLLSGELNTLVSSKSRTALLGATLSIPVYQGGRGSAEIELAENQLEEQRRVLQLQEIQAYQEVEQALARLALSREQLLTQQAFVKAAQETAALTKERYSRGLVNYIDVVDADRQVLEAERLSAQLLGREWLATVQLIQALGGSY